MKISEEKRKKISEHILLFLFQENPKPIFTSYIAKEVARDEEFTKKILKELKSQGLIIEVKKNKEGIDYLRRSRWKLSDKAYIFYREAQSSFPSS